MRKLWTESEINLLKVLYPHQPTQRIADVLGRNVRSVYSKANTLGLKKSDEYLQGPQSGRLDGVTGKDTRFKKGHKTWNKGMKGLDIGGKATRFKIGQKPHTWKPVGHERITPDGYLERKMTDTGVTRVDYVQVHRMVWEEHNGPIPDGHIVAFKDGNRRNFDPANLELITRAEIMKRNSYHNYPKEIAQLIQLRGAVQRQINKRLKP